MAVVSRFSAINLSSGAGARTFTATATVQDTPAGQSVTITISNTPSGLTPPVNPSIGGFQLRVFIDAQQLNAGPTPGGHIRNFALNETAAEQTVTLHFTNDGTSGGSPRVGTLRMQLFADSQNDPAPTNRYLVHSDGASGQVLPAGYSVTQRDQGWVRSGTTVTTIISNQSAGGSKSSPFQYGDQMFHRVVLGAQAYEAVSVTHTFGPISEATSPASAGPNLDKTLTGVVDNRFNATSESRSATVAAGNSTLTGSAEFYATTLTTDSATVDPRLTAAHLLQISDPNFGTPPLSKNEAGKQRLNADLGYITTNFRAARGSIAGNAISEGKNGITYSMTLSADIDPTIQKSRTGVVTANAGGEPGWGPTFLVWDSSLPGGGWSKSVSITAPSNITGSAYLLNSTETYTLLASDPRIVVVSGGGASGNEDSHFTPGNNFIAAIAPVRIDTGKLLDPTNDSLSEPKAALVRLNTTTGKAQYLDTGTLTWTNVGDGAITYFTLVAANLVIPGADSRVYLRTFGASGAMTTVDTTGWEKFDVIVVGTIKSRSTPYGNYMQIPVVAGVNPHGQHEFDPIGLFS